MSTKYEITNDSTTGKQNITREGELIATRDPETGSVDYLPDMDRYRAPVSALLREQGYDKPPVTPPEVAARQVARTAGERPPAEPQPGTGTDSTSETVEEKRARLKAELAELDDPQGQTAEQKELAALRAENARLKASKPGAAPVEQAKLTKTMAGNDPLLQQYVAEGAPAFDPAAGDKTPVFVNWLYEKHPDHAEKRYFGRRTHRGLN